MSSDNRYSFGDSSKASGQEAQKATERAVEEQSTTCVEIATEPGKPTLELLSNDGRTAQVKWEMKESGKVKYTVLLEWKGQRIEKIHYAKQAVFENLEPGSIYGVCVCAEFEGEVGPYSELLTFPSAPLPVRKVEVAHNPLAPESSVFIKITDPDQSEREYEVTIDDLGADGANSVPKITRMTTFPVEKLNSESLYRVYVRARIESTLGGDILFSKRTYCDCEIQTYPPQVSEPKKEKISVRIFRITWNSTAGAESYLVRWKSNKACDFEERRTEDNYLVIENLTQGCHYEVTVAAINSAGTGKRSSPLRFQTAPCGPVDFKVEKYQSSPDTAFVVSLVDPNPGEKRYRFVAQPLSTDEDVIMESDKCLALMQNLTPGERYNLYSEIVDTTNQNTSEKTFYKGLAQTCPAEVTGLVAEIQQDTCLQLSWDPLDLQPLRYHIAIRINGQDVPPEYTDKTWFSMSDLSRSSTYTVMVAAENDAGRGRFCKQKECRTRPAEPLRIIVKKCPQNPTSTLTVWVEDDDLVRKQYKVEARDAEDAVARSVVTHEKYAVLGGLRSGTAYRVNVVAFDGKLESYPVWASQL